MVGAGRLLGNARLPQPRWSHVERGPARITRHATSRRAWRVSPRTLTNCGGMRAGVALGVAPSWSASVVHVALRMAAATKASDSEAAPSAPRCSQYWQHPRRSGWPTSVIPGVHRCSAESAFNSTRSAYSALTSSTASAFGPSLHRSQFAYVACTAVFSEQHTDEH
jgi:hypothetical protein